MRGPRQYTLKIEVEIRDQDDAEHSQPGSVTARADALDVEWVSGNDRDALRQFFDLYLRTPIPDGMSIVEYSTSRQFTARARRLAEIARRAQIEAPFNQPPQPRPLQDEEVNRQHAEIRERRDRAAEAAESSETHLLAQAITDIDALLARVERVRARNAKLREMLMYLREAFEIDDVADDPISREVLWLLMKEGDEPL